MTIPSLPAFFDMPYTDKEGKLTPDSHLYNDQTFQVLNYIVTLLNDAFSSTISSTVNGNTAVLDGIAPPPKTTAQIAALQPNVSNGTMWFNTDLKKLQVKTDTGIIETITST